MRAGRLVPVLVAAVLAGACGGGDERESTGDSIAAIPTTTPDGVVLIGPDGVATTWMPDDFTDSCTEQLQGVRNGAWLLGASSELGEGGVYEVTPDGTVRIELPPGFITVL